MKNINISFAKLENILVILKLFDSKNNGKNNVFFTFSVNGKRCARHQMTIRSSGRKNIGSFSVTPKAS